MLELVNTIVVCITHVAVRWSLMHELRAPKKFLRKNNYYGQGFTLIFPKPQLKIFLDEPYESSKMSLVFQNVLEEISNRQTDRQID